MKSPILLFLIMLFCLNIYGQIDFQDHVIIENSTSVRALQSTFAADIDGDGDMDILSASQQDNKIAWYENINGQGRFSTQKIISTNIDGAFTVFAADIDGDGDMDVLATNTNGTHKLVWFENTNGLGVFGTQQIIDFNNRGFLTIDAVDFDNDGDIDILSANGVAIVWYENLDGQGDFSASQLVFNTTPSQTLGAVVRAFDINGDGFQDVLASYYLGNNFHTKKTVWFTNLEGTGSFSSEHIIAEELASDVFAFDIDGDNDLDVVTALSDSQTIAWYENTDGQGNLGSQQIIAIDVDYNMSLFAADLNGDNHLDLLATSRDNNKVIWYQNTDGIGTFGEEQIITNLVRSPMGVLAVDIDGDEDMDVLSASHVDSKIAWYQNTDGLGHFGQQQTVISSALSANTVFATDLDGDGDIDAISASEDDNKIAWYENLDGQGNYGIQQSISVTADGVKTVFAIDLDGDGDKDIVAASYNNVIDYKVFWHENLDGLGHFGEEQIISDKDAIAVYATDMDEDGDVDILFAGTHIYWYENVDGLGDFATQHVITGFSATSIHVLDMDNDGDVDVLATDNNNKIAWYKNQGQGDFGVGVQIEIVTLSFGPISIYPTDLDGDNDMDIIAGSESGIVWYENTDGSGSFGSEQAIYTTLSRPITDVSAADIDSDGDIDVVATNRIIDRVAWYENRDGLFDGQQQIISENVDRVNSLYLVDVDGDGDVDVFSSSAFDGKIAWYENHGVLGNRIKGKLRFDLNENACSENDLPMPNMLISTSNEIEERSTFTQVDGSFILEADEGNYQTFITNLPAYYSATPNVHNSDFTGVGHIDTTDFCVTATEIVNDVNITILPPTQAIIGLFATYQIVYHNAGTSQISGHIALEYDPTKLAFIEADSSVVSQTGNSLTFDYFNLNPFETRIIEVTFSLGIPPAVTVNSILIFNATINPIDGDNTAYDNTYTLTQQAVGSYDPNDITVLEGERILLENADKYLHYVIRFQNTGTASALNIRVHNTLDTKLDWNSLQLENSSHSNHIEIQGGNEVDFIFNAIYLPDSTANEAASHGFIAYKIKPKASVILGDIFYNKADIYFDFNPAIETNTVATEIAEPVGFDELNQVYFTVYPIPTTGILFIKSEVQITHIEIYNLQGQLILANINEQKIDLSSLSKGVYFCSITDKNGTKGVCKVVR